MCRRLSTVQCSVTCGEGQQRYAIHCVLNNVSVNAALCGTRPVAVLVNCTMPPCEKKVFFTRLFFIMFFIYMLYIVYFLFLKKCAFTFCFVIEFSQIFCFLCAFERFIYIVLSKFHTSRMNLIKSFSYFRIFSKKKTPEALLITLLFSINSPPGKLAARIHVRLLGRGNQALGHPAFRQQPRVRIPQ